MKNFIKNNYHKHLIIGALIGFVYVGVIRFLTSTDLTIELFLGAFLATCAGIGWEREQTYRNENVKWDWLDVLFSGIGGLLGTVILNLIF